MMAGEFRASFASTVAANSLTIGKTGMAKLAGNRPPAPE